MFEDLRQWHSILKLTLKQLETFVFVSDLGGFGKAADQLNTTQPNVSSRISSLEECLGVSLMERDAGSIRLTSKGKKLLDQARKVVQSVDDLIHIAEAHDLYDGVVRIGVTEMVAHTWLNQFLKQFKARYPNTLIELIVDLAANLERELFHNNLDLTFQSGPFVHSMSGNLELGEFPMIWVTSPHSELCEIAEIEISDFASQPVITHAKNTLAYQEVATHFAAGAKNAVRLVPSSNLMVSVQMVADGYGTGVLLKPLVEEHLKAKALIALDYDWKPKQLAFFARFNSDRAPKVVENAALIAQIISQEMAATYNIE